MQQQHKLPPRAPSPQGFGGGLTLFPMQGIGIGIGASSSSSQAAAAAAATSASASARAGEQMAYEDAWKASHPDFRTPFSSIEDATNRLIPYHVFAEYGEEDTDNGGTEEMSSEERWDKGVMEVVEKQIAEFEKQVLTFNVLSRKRSEERLMAERALLHDEHCATERLRATIIVQQERQQRRQQQEEAERASRLALAQAQAQVAGAWPLVQPTPSAWQQALAAVAASRGEVLVPVQVEAAAQSAAMHQQLDPATAGAWLVMHQQQQQQQQLLQHQQQQQQQLLQQQLDLGAWPTYAAPHGGSSSMGQAGPSVVWHEQTGEQAMGGTAAGGNGMAQPWWMTGAQRREQ